MEKSMFDTRLRPSDTYGPPPSLRLPKSTILSTHGTKVLPFSTMPTVFPKLKSCHYRRRLRSVSGGGGGGIRAAKTTEAITAVVIVKLPLSLGDKDAEDIRRSIFRLELVSSELDPKTESEKDTIIAYLPWLHNYDWNTAEYAKYLCYMEIPKKFGSVGAVIVENAAPTELFIQDIYLFGTYIGYPDITCNTWAGTVYHSNQRRRVFFPNMDSYLPSQTPSGLKKLREKELEYRRGNGKGDRRKYERIYDYAEYNDLGDPDKSKELARPVLGGEKHPYPRRCRTGRDACRKDPFSEERTRGSIYVPKDEEIFDVKTRTLNGDTVEEVLDSLLSKIRATHTDHNLGFPSFHAIDSLFTKGNELPQVEEDQGLLEKHGDQILRFKTPEQIDRDHFSWLRDEEFARQTLAGANPYSIQLVTEWPLKSELDPKIYGPPESAITTEIVEQGIGHSMAVDEAVKGKKLFMLDYHDLLLPFVKKVREIEGTTLYGSRTLFFLNPDSTLKPIAIELTRPTIDDQPQWKQVFLPGTNNTDTWLWRLAKSHVCAHDSCYHQLVNHWLRTHYCTEPYIIAANRQLSEMHPIYRLLRPYFRDTMKINSIARRALMNADGIIESSFSLRKYSMEFSSVAYDKFWRFDMEGLPADLIRRGMAVEDPTAKHGVKLTIKDYPFADDGLLIWTAIKQWVINYVDHYYPDSNLVESDQELQGWWTEVRTKGHGDKKDEPWWPVLKTVENLIEILTTIIWVASCHHSAVNFGQYTYGGYFPNRPTIARTNMPTEDPSEQGLEKFMENPELAFLQSFPSQIQATTVMTVLDVLSTQSIDEQYLGRVMEEQWYRISGPWSGFDRFRERMKKIEAIIDARNMDLKLKNRTGAGIVPYQLLKPSVEGTGMGIPNSISI